MTELYLKNTKKTDSYIIFSIIFVVAFIVNFIPLTMLSYKMPSMIFILGKALVLMLSLLKIVIYDRFQYKEVIIYMLVSLTLLFNWYFTQYQDFIVLFFLSLSARGIDREYIVKLSLISLLIGTIFVILLSKVGVIENLIFLRYSYTGVITRQSFGTIYPTVLGSIIFFITLQYLYLRKKNNIFDIVIFGCTAFFIEYYTNNRLVVVLLLCVIIYCIINFFIDIDAMKVYSLIKYFWLVVVVILPILFIYISQNYDNSTYWMFELNKLLSQRIRLSWEGFMNYPITIFGQHVNQNGWGGGKELGYGVEYFYLDSLPITLLLSKGVIIFIVYLFYNFCFIKKALDKKDTKLAIILTFIVIYDLVDDKSIRSSLNPFFIFSLNYILDHKGNHIIGKG